MMKLVTPKSEPRQDFELTPDEIAREGARRLLVRALDLEVDDYVRRHIQSPASIVKLKKIWEAELETWSRRPITKKYVYIWVDGVNVEIRLGEDEKLCLSDH